MNTARHVPRARVLALLHGHSVTGQIPPLEEVFKYCKNLKMCGQLFLGSLERLATEAYRLQEDSSE